MNVIPFLKRLQRGRIYIALKEELPEPTALFEYSAITYRITVTETVHPD